ncbi:putative ABC transporter permease protein YtcP [Spirochaetia bacterium]|nr:putative ABC transporter permease protein YtcP [Spirochaetia bacterium]
MQEKNNGKITHVRNSADRLFDFFNILFIGVIGLLCILPFINVLAKSLSSEAAVVSGKVVLWPINLNIKAYRYIFSNSLFWNSMKNSVFVTVAGAVLDTAFTLFVAYAISRKHLVGRSVIYFLYVFTMLFSGGIIPTFLVVKQVGLLDKLPALFLPTVVTVFNMTLIRNYFMTIPPSLEESAKMDGASNLNVLFRIMIPLAAPAIATVALFAAVGLWNDYFTPLMYIQSRLNRTLQVFLRGVVDMSQDANMNDFDSISELAQETIRGATVFAATLPILLVYPFLQRYFVSGMTIGAVKE